MKGRECPQISIIMPVYNSKDFIETAINSVLRQTYKSFELIIVDDGSTDGSSEVCDAYGNLSNVRVFHKSNGGVCSARNYGIKLAEGQYVCFIDNDDEYDPMYCEKLISAAKSTNADIIKCGRKNIVVTVNGNILSENSKTVKKDVNYCFNDFKRDYIYLKKIEIFYSVWNGLYKLDTIKTSGILFDEKVKNGNEDLIFNYKFVRQCESITVISDVLYNHYYRNGHSTSLKFNVNQINTRIEAIILELDLANTENERKYILTEGIRECFRILSYADDYKTKNIYSDFIEQKLSWEKGLICWVCKSKEVSTINKFELVLIWARCYNLYFMLRNLRRKV